MLIIQLIRDYLNGEKMPERIRYGMMQDGYQYFRWDAEAEEYVCEADDKCFLSLVPWHHLRDFVEVAEQTEPQTCEECEHWSDTEDGCADRHGCKTEPQTIVEDINRRVEMVKKEWEVRHIEPKDEPQNGYQTFNGTSVYVSRFEDEPQSDCPWK